MEIAKNNKVHYCYRVQREYIGDDLKFAELDTAKYLEDNSPENRANKKLPINLYLHELRSRTYRMWYAMKEKNSRLAEIPAFSTLPSYDYRMNPEMRDLFLSNA